MRVAAVALASCALVLATSTPVPAAEGTAHGLFAGDRSAQFTADAAARGRTAYARSCLSCHGATLEGTQVGPPLTGEVFESHWREHSRAAFAQKIRTTMPPGGGGSLSSRAYADVEA